MALIEEAWTSLISFSCGAGLCLLPLVDYNPFYKGLWQSSWILIIAIYVAIVNIVEYLMYQSRRTLLQVYIRGSFLGVVFGLALLLSFSNTTWQHFGWYLTSLSFFHFSEYFITAATNPRSLTLDSYLLDHSMEYKVAALASWMEFSIEWFLFPGMKQLRWLSLLGLVMVVGGEVLRKVSMVTASTNFNHYVQTYKQKDHCLVTHGVYALFRHPAYVGWFYWSLGTQIVLCNPVCLVAYTIVSWRFFNRRIHEEEIFLLNFFGEDYVRYQERVGTGLPLIKGYSDDLSKQD